MNAITSTWRQLVRRRLWPVALLLLGALAAVPVLLAREPAVPEPIAPVPVTTTADDSIAEPVVAQVTAEDRNRRRRVLGVRKDPFRPAPVKAAKADKPEQEAPKDDAPKTDTPSTGGPASPTGGEPAPEKRYYSPGTIVVRFSDTSSDQSTRLVLSKFEALPDDEFPFLIYMGLTKNGKKAKFLVDASVEVDGDGVCKPHPASCETIELAVGETEFLDVLDPEAEGSDEEPEDGEETEPELLAQFQVDLVDIKRAGDDDVR
jgi:hypothetical protein